MHTTPYIFEVISWIFKWMHLLFAFFRYIRLLFWDTSVVSFKHLIDEVTSNMGPTIRRLYILPGPLITVNTVYLLSNWSFISLGCFFMFDFFLSLTLYICIFCVFCIFHFSFLFVLIRSWFSWYILDFVIISKVQSNVYLPFF
jgi:hypothetical protein